MAIVVQDEQPAAAAAQQQQREPAYVPPSAPPKQDVAPVHAQVLAVVGQPRQVQVTCPPGVMPGQLVEIDTPDGLIVHVVVPQGVVPGGAFITTF